MESVENLMIHMYLKMFTILLVLEFSKITESVDSTAKLTTTVSATNTLLTLMELVNASYLSSSGTSATLTVELKIHHRILRMPNHFAMSVKHITSMRVE
jgi:hypothetical protein